MKTILTLLLIVPSLYLKEKTPLQSSTNIDQLFLKKLNTYRSYYKVEPLAWNDNIYNMSVHHSNYMVKADTISHFEEKPVPNFKLIYSLHNRANYFGVRLPVAENVVGGFTTIVINKRTLFSDFVNLIWKVKLIDSTPKELAIYYCIFGWHNSTNGHKEIMLSKKFTTGVVSLRYSYSAINHKDRFFGGADTQVIRIFAVLNVAGKE